MKGIVLDGAGLLLSEDDTVATALEDLEAGHRVDHNEYQVELTEDVPFGHKFAVVPMDVGDAIHKYGEVIGRATRRIDPGEWVHTHNCESTRGRGDLAAGEVAR